MCWPSTLGRTCRLPAGVPGRDLEATHCRGAHAYPDVTRTCSPHRLRVRAQRHRQPVHAVRAARRLAPRRGEAPHRRRLRSRLERSGRSPLPARQDHRAGPGQSQHPQQGVTLRSLSGRRSQTAGRALRMALHAQARQLARSRGPNSVSSPLSVSIAASQTNRPSSRKSPLGNTTEMPITQRQTGNSQPNPLESN